MAEQPVMQLCGTQHSRTSANNKYIHFLLVTEPFNHLMHAPHLCKDYGLSIQQKEVTTHLVVSDALSMSNLTIYIIPEDAETKLSMAFYER